MKQLSNYEETFDAVTTAVGGVIDLRGAKSYSIQAIANENTPPAVSFVAGDVSAAANTIAAPAHDFTTGLAVDVVDDGGGLPGGLTEVTVYAIVVDEDTLQLAADLAGALAGTAIDISSTGEGSLEPVALANATLTFRKSNVEAVLNPTYSYRSADWVTIDSALAITGDETNMLEVTDPDYKAAVAVYTMDSGRLSTTQHVFVKGLGSGSAGGRRDPLGTQTPGV